MNNKFNHSKQPWSCIYHLLTTMINIYYPPYKNASHQYLLSSKKHFWTLLLIYLHFSHHTTATIPFWGSLLRNNHTIYQTSTVDPVMIGLAASSIWSRSDSLPRLILATLHKTTFNIIGNHKPSLTAMKHCQSIWTNRIFDHRLPSRTINNRC